MSKKSSIVSPDDEVILIGGGGHARVIFSLLKRLRVRITGYTATEATRDFPCPYLGTDAVLLSEDFASCKVLAVGVGLPAPNPKRLVMIRNFLDAGFEVPTIFAGSSLVASDTRAVDGAAVLDGAIVATGSRLGVGSIVNHQASVDHDCVIGDNVHIGPGATLCGNVHVEPHSLIGAGATIIPGTRIARNCVVAAGATVTANTEPDSMYAGCPARRIRQVRPGQSTY
jgi:sugar O-acyltransferase (sialic acid O-acetyltransferase NeuD family)